MANDYTLPNSDSIYVSRINDSEADLLSNLGTCQMGIANDTGRIVAMNNSDVASRAIVETGGTVDVPGDLELTNGDFIGIDTQTDLMQLNTAVLTVNADLIVDTGGNIRIDNNKYVGVEGDTDLLKLSIDTLLVSGEINVTGIANLDAGADIESNVDIAGTLDSHGAVHLYSTAEIDGTLQCDGLLDANNGADIEGNVDIAGTLDVNTGLDMNSSAISNATTIQSSGDIYTTAFTDYTSSSTIVGWSGTPSGKVQYKLIGKLCFVKVYINGTSNSTEVYFTLPVVPNVIGAGAYEVIGSIFGVDDNVGGVVSVYYESAHFRCCYGTTLVPTTWTNTGDKAIGGTFVFETT